MATILLYGFSPGEVLQLQTLVGFLPDIRVIPVDRKGCGMTIGDVLAGKTPPPMAFSSELERRMVVLDQVQGELLSLLLSAVDQVTKDPKLLRALVTETNRSWTGAYLHGHLLEEARALGQG